MHSDGCNSLPLVSQESGTFDVFVNSKESKDAVPTKVHTYRVSDGVIPCFGELALMYDKPRAATVKCTEAGVLWGIDREAFGYVRTHANDRDITGLLAKVRLHTFLRCVAIPRVCTRVSK